MQGIHITGASGSGVTTLGRSLAMRLGWTHLDTDHFYWLPGNPPFQDRRPLEPRLEMMEQAFADAASGWVLSGSLDGWGDVFIPQFSAVIFLYTPPALRMARLVAREHERYGEAILPGGPMHAHHVEFVQWAEGYDRGDRSGRSLGRHETWLASLPCPVLRLDGAASTDALADQAIKVLFDGN